LDQSKKEENLLKHTVIDQRHVFLVSMNKTSDLSESECIEDFRKKGAALQAMVEEEELAAVQIIADQTINRKESEAFLEGVLLSQYQFLNYKSEKKEQSFTKIVLLSGMPDASKVDEIRAVVSATCFARDLVNEPVITLNTQELSHRFIEAGNEAGFVTDILGKAGIEELKMGGLLGVNKGSIDPPAFNILTYKPENAVNDKPLIFVGKGVVYDTGGSNLKPGNYMTTMKSDMGGGAAAAGAIYAVAKAKLPLYTVALIPATDNRIGENALVPDDVITISDGTTVEVKNTDAEGRLILADALVYAKNLQPMLVIDLATLTGAAEAITGSYGSAMIHKDAEQFVDDLKESGEAVYERLHELPVWREFRDQLKSDIADISNLGGRIGGATTAGMFLRHFTDYPWIHLDIAGPAFLEKAEGYKKSGGTGAGVRLLFNFAKKMAVK
jgi:leucyl aminopeptidase